MTDAQLQAFSGHKKLENLYKYIKVDANENLKVMLKAEQKKEIAQSSPKPERKRDFKAAMKKAEEKREALNEIRNEPGWKETFKGKQDAITNWTQNMRVTRQKVS